MRFAVCLNIHRALNFDRMQPQNNEVLLSKRDGAREQCWFGGQPCDFDGFELPTWLHSSLLDGCTCLPGPMHPVGRGEAVPDVPQGLALPRKQLDACRPAD